MRAERVSLETITVRDMGDNDTAFCWSQRSPTGSRPKTTEETP